mgnify:FL=1|jgi:hypothetical protein
MIYEVKITTTYKSVTYVVKAENVLEAEEEALKKLEKDVPKDHITAGQYHIDHIENLKEAH